MWNLLAYGVLVSVLACAVFVGSVVLGVVVCAITYLVDSVRSW